MKINLAGVQIATGQKARETELAELRSKLEAIEKSQAVIEFDLEGRIVSANNNFLNTMGYMLDEVIGQHHSIFVDSDYAASNEYIQFWDRLRNGQFETAEFRRVAKDGSHVWIQATYTPIRDRDGNITKVVKFATDITQAKLANSNYQGQIDAIHKAQAVIEFELDGTIITANENFLATMGYSLNEVKGQHHSMFAPPGLKDSVEYREFWDLLGQGQYQAGEFKRVDKAGKDVWIQASYNPILDTDGNPIKVVKFASDITASKRQAANFHGQISAIHKAQAVIEFELDGTIITANDNFLGAMGYGLDEVQGKHHSLFVDSETKASSEYQQFWQDLAAGKYKAGEFRRVNKAGKDIWIQASYNPILDTEGRPFKVVKFASDITESKRKAANFQGQIDAIHKAQAVIEFELDGTIITANDNFLGAMGYRLDEIQGKHHAMFVDGDTKASSEYKQFWKDLASGNYQAGEFKRVNKTGDDVWIQASYNPILDSQGRPFKVVKFASDITASKLQAANFQGQIDAIHKAQAVIEFELDGTILTANENFLATMGYSLDEVKGQHHSMFAPPGMKESQEYREFWTLLGKGEYQAGEFKRIDKASKDVWIQASYNPILDADGKPFKVVKFATDITESKRQSANFQGQIDAIHKAQAVIEFELDGTILTANENFLATMGYSLDEVKGNHHSMFAPPGLKDSQEYRDFWALLGKGEYQAGEFKRIDKAGKDVWIHASYNPILDAEGKPFKVVKFATDITESKRQSANFQGQIDAIHKAQAVIEFELDGTILTANENFLTTMGYSLDEVKGNHHSMFAPPGLKDSQEYRDFWRSLGDGHYQAGEFKRIGKSGDEIWIQASYNPILDAEGKPFKVVKFASDITEQKAQAEVNARNADISNALKLCNANVMLADNDLNVVYLNDGMEAMLKEQEQQLQTELPHFQVNTIVGTCVDVFHKDPSLQRGIISGLEKATTSRLKLAGFTYDLTTSPWLNGDGDRIGTVVEWYDLTEELAAKEKADSIARENARIRQALDNVSTNTMIANADNEIIYMNAAIDDMMSTAEKDIKTVLPNFNADSLIGECMDVFHKSPAHQRDMINRLETTYSTEIKVGPRTFGLIANPIRDKDSSRIGTVVEWNDRTEEVAIEREIADLITAAGDGDLSSRIEEEGKSGFFLNLAGGLNQLIGIADGVITETVEMLDAMAHGDLTKRINSDYKGAFNKLKSDANSTAEKLTEVIGRISNASSAVASGAEEIAQGNTDLSQRTEEQASSLEETASSMEQMTSTVRQNADNAKVANDLAADATNKAQKGGDVVKRAVNSMSEINESSKKIADIIGVIDEIAFQTNLLALNAAVEAARAGEQGRGFAVVAGEVRNLAQRSAAAAKEIKDLIRDSVAKVQDGSQLVNESGATLNEIVEAISRVTTMIADISNASNEQSEGIEQVNKAVTQMDEMTQQNAALVEEASAAGEAMADQARGMKQILGFFNANDSGGQLASLPPMAPSSAPIAAPVAAAPVPIESPSSNMDFADDDEEWEEF